ncbi:MAG: glycerophosphodiester phosphodiesterase [Acidobacteria bacterium]|nr:glycerophosphodiester phosphodiesterase [Acidobacteriota bacterium]
MSRKRIAVHGHRGARALFPETTLAALRHAIDAGADFIELDLAVTKDDRIVVSHDPVLDPRLCTAPPGSVVRRLTFDELLKWDFGCLKNPRFPRQTPAPGSRMLALEEVFNLAREVPVQFNLEVKSFPQFPEYAPPPDRFAQLLNEAIRSAGLGDRAVVQSFDFRILHEMKKLAPGLRLAALYSPGLADPVAIARQAGVSILAPDHRLLAARRIRAAHGAGLEVIAWTVNTAREWARLIRAGIDGIITDDPAGLIDYLKRAGLR